MKLFLLGVLVSSVVWLAVLYAQSNGIIEIFSPPTPPAALTAEAIVTPVDTDSAEIGKPPRHKKRRAGGRHRNRDAGLPKETDLGYQRGEGEVGDDLQTAERTVSMNGGAEDQLSNAEIEAAIDRRFNGIERCLALMPPDAPTKGRLVIGMNISGSGQVEKVNLSGPNAMIQGEPGACFRRIVSAMKFRTFGGPNMVVHYPITFE